MPDNEEVMKAVTELRETVESKNYLKALDEPKVKRINVVLDAYEAKNAELTKVQQDSANLVVDLKELKELRLEEKEADEKRQKEIKGQIDDLEAEVARNAQKPTDANPHAYREGEEYKAVNNFCRLGSDITIEEKALLRTDIAADGGILVPKELDNVITKKIVEIDGMRAISRVRTISGKSIELVIRNSIPTAVFEGEAETGTDSASDYESVTITPFRHTFTTPVTQDQLMNAQFDMESEITSDAGEAFAFGEGANFVTGTGHKQPEGFLTNSSISVIAADTAGTGGKIYENDVITITGELKVGYNPTYVLHRKSLAAIRVLRATTGLFLWQPGMNGPVANTLNGFPYILAQTMPEEASLAKALAFGDFRRGYTVVDRVGVSVIRDEFTLKKRAIVEFTMNRWVTGFTNLPEAIKILQLETT